MERIKIKRIENDESSEPCSEPGCSEPLRFRFIIDGSESINFCSRHGVDLSREFTTALAGRAKGGLYFDKR